MENTNLVPEMQEENLNEQMQIRRGKLKALQDKGQDPYVKTKYDVTDYAKDVVENYNDEAEDHGTASLAGRQARTWERRSGRRLQRRVRRLARAAACSCRRRN